MLRSADKKILVLVMTIILTLLTGVKSSRSFALRTLKKGDKITNYAIEMFDGEKRSIEDLSGEKGLMVVFWTTWSERSLNLLKFANDVLKAEYIDKGITVVGINVEHQSISDAELRKLTGVVEDLGITIPLGIDRGLVIYDEIGVISTPTTLLISKELTIEEAYPGFPTAAKENLKSILNAFLGIEEEKPAQEAQYLLAKKPKNNALLYYNLGKNLYKRYITQKGELPRVPKNVIDKLDEAIKRDPDFYSPYLLKAIIYHKTKDEEKKEETLKIIDEKGFSDPVELRDLAYMYFILDMPARSDELLVTLKETIPDDPTISLLQALLAVKSDRNEEASALFKEIIQKGGLPFDLGSFVDPETGEIGKGEEPEKPVIQIPEKVLNISKH